LGSCSHTLAALGLACPVTGHWERCYTVPRRAASASSASSCRTAKNVGDWPMNSLSAVTALTVATAPPLPCIWVGRMIETAGNLRLRKMVGSGMIRLVWKSCPPNGRTLRSGKINYLLGWPSQEAQGALLDDDAHHIIRPR
jgi:hypothetical protein